MFTLSMIKNADFNFLLEQSIEEAEEVEDDEKYLLIHCCSNNSLDHLSVSIHYDDYFHSDNSALGVVVESIVRW